MSELYVVRFGAPDEEAEIEEDEEDDGTDTKSTFAYFGLAFYHACVLEHSIVNLLVGSRLVAAKEAAERLLADPWEKRFKDTMMELVRRAAPYTKDDPELPDNLVHAVKLRNHLAHDFWRERAEDFCSDAGRGDMIAYLIEARDHFIQTDARLEERPGKLGRARWGSPRRRSLPVTRRCFDGLRPATPNEALTRHTLPLPSPTLQERAAPRRRQLTFPSPVGVYVTLKGATTNLHRGHRLYGGTSKVSIPVP